jgi:hypothetical protein
MSKKNRQSVTVETPVEVAPVEVAPEAEGVWVAEGFTAPVEPIDVSPPTIPAPPVEVVPADEEPPPPQLLVMVTTCKGRAIHLMQTLREKLGQCDVLVVVDYACPQNIADLISSIELPPEERSKLVFIRIRDDQAAKEWNAGRARNCGLAWVLDGCPSARVAFLDSDVAPQEGFAAWCRSMPTNQVGIAARTPEGFDLRDYGGLIVGDAELFDRIGRYDEEFPEYGAEDHEMRLRCWHVGMVDAFARVPLEVLRFVKHPDAMRVRFNRVKNCSAAAKQMHVHQLARTAKYKNRPDYPAWYLGPKRPTQCV